MIPLQKPLREASGGGKQLSWAKDRLKAHSTPDFYQPLHHENCLTTAGTIPVIIPLQQFFPLLAL